MEGVMDLAELFYRIVINMKASIDTDYVTEVDVIILTMVLVTMANGRRDQKMVMESLITLMAVHIVDHGRTERSTDMLNIFIKTAMSMKAHGNKTSVMASVHTSLKNLASHLKQHGLMEFPKVRLKSFIQIFTIMAIGIKHIQLGKVHLHSAQNT